MLKNVGIGKYILNIQNRKKLLYLWWNFKFHLIVFYSLYLELRTSTLIDLAILVYKYVNGNYSFVSVCIDI